MLTFFENNSLPQSNKPALVVHNMQKSLCTRDLAKDHFFIKIKQFVIKPPPFTSAIQEVHEESMNEQRFRQFETSIKELRSESNPYIENSLREWLQPEEFELLNQRVVTRFGKNLHHAYPVVCRHELLDALHDVLPELLQINNTVPA
jgi:hypothetical protein